MKSIRPASSFVNILLFTSGIMVFAWFIHSKTYMQFVAIAALALPCIALYRHTLNASRPMDMIHSERPAWFKSSLLAGILLGAGSAIYYRINNGSPPLPVSLTLFAPVALLIGIAEEFVFRGAAFYILNKWPVYITIAITALLHASYKSLLFLQPNLLHPIDTRFLFGATFLAGLLIGLIRHTGGSVIPPMMAHGIWDAMVYGDSPAAPWWVW